MRSIVQRLYRHELPHLFVPYPLARRAIVAMSERAWERDADLREQACWHQRFLVGKSTRAGEVEELAKRYVIETYLRIERYWRPRAVTRRPPKHSDRLLALSRDQRGVVISFLHHGDYLGAVGSIGRTGVPVNVAANSVFFTPEADVIERQSLRSVRIRGVHAFGATGSRERIRSLLLAGENVAIATDIIGTMVVSVLGREVRTASGAARLALETNSWVLPILAHQRGHHQEASFGEPIDPSDFTDPQPLLAEMVRRFEPALLAWPEGFERPLRRWRPTGADLDEFGWAEGVTFKI